MMKHIITFERLKEEELHLLHRWLNTDFVIEWYEKDGMTLEQVYSDFIPKITGEEPIHPFIIKCNDKRVGYIQTYLIDDFPDYCIYVDAKEKSFAMDLFIGEEEYIHKGLGSKILKEFLSNHAFDLNDSECCIIGPEPSNIVAIKAYEKAGFKYYKTINTSDGTEEYLMKLYKSEFLNQEYE